MQQCGSSLIPKTAHVLVQASKRPLSASSQSTGNSETNLSKTPENA